MKKALSNSPNSPNSPEQGKENTPEDSNIPARAIQRRKITASTIDAMAQYVAIGHTETEAAHLCGVRPSTWREFKSRNLARATKWTETMEGYKARLINHNLKQVQKAADGIGVKYPDFRASLAILKFQDAKRFGDSPAVEINAPQINVNVLKSACDQVMKLLDAGPKQLPEPAPSEGETA